MIYGEHFGGGRPIIRYNDVYSAGGLLYAGDIPNLTGIDSNISMDPAFADTAAGDFRLQLGSSCIDVGNTAAPELPGFDLAGRARIQDGDMNGSAIVDLGAFEFGGTLLLAAAGPDIAQACSGATTPVRLDGSASTGESLTFAWSAPGVVFDDPSSARPTGAFPVGSTDVTLVVTSGSESAVDTMRVTIVDGAGPTLSVSVSPALLWPPNHQLVPVHATVTANDACSSDPHVSLLWVASNEPDAGKGNHAGDIQDASPGTADFDLQLRAERSGGQKGGRVYTLCYEVRDQAGNADTACAAVLVPHDQGGRAQLSESVGASSLVLFGGAGMDARRVAVGSVEIRVGERLTFRASGANPEFRDADGDGDVDAVVTLQRAATDAAGVPFATWMAQGRGYVAVLSSATAAVETTPVAFAASVTPNPAVGAALLRYGVPRAEHVRLAIYDVRGRCVATLADGIRPAGVHEATFRPATGGKAQVYFYRFEMKGQVRTGKFVVMH